MLFYLFVCVIISACGVKNDPKNPEQNAYPSVLDEYQKKIKSTFDGKFQPNTVNRE